jgi:two-component system chemotaxis response regulator CheB
MKARVLIVDDSATVRRFLTDALASDPAIEVVGTASNGKIALQKLTQVNPDLVTLDLEMPEMDGLATLAELRKTHPRLPVVMFSAQTRAGAVSTLNALAQGATDYVAKPTGGMDASLRIVQQELAPKIKALCTGSKRNSAALQRQAGSVRRTPTTPATIELLAIGVSTGGPNALTEIFRNLAADLSVPIVIAQHMPAVFTGYLAERLSAVSAVPVREAKSGETLTPGGAWLAPGNFHLTIKAGPRGLITHLNQDPPENSCRPAVDVLFRSVAQVVGGRALAIVLTGMGSDGLRGCQTIVEAGGRVLVQDEASSVVWGMPGSVARAGLAERVLPLNQIASEIVALVQPARPNHPATAGCNP